jgi:hypothetical protein
VGTLTISLGKCLNSSSVKSVEFSSFYEIVEFFRNPIKIEHTIDQYLIKTKKERSEVKSKIPYFVGAEFTKGKRRAADIKSRQFLTIDFDYAHKNWREVITKNLMCDYLITSSLSYSEFHDRYKLHLIVPLDQGIQCKEVLKETVIEFLNRINCPLDWIDDSASLDMSRAFLMPIVLSGGMFIHEFKTNGIPFNVKNTTQNVSTIKLRMLPSKMDGIKGAYCRLYNAREVFERYAEQYGYATGTNGRYTYINGTSSDGITFYDNDEFLSSFHSTDPLSAKPLWSAYDLYVFFEHGGDEAQADVELHSIPSIAASIAKDYECTPPCLIPIQADNMRHATEIMSSQKALEFLRKHMYVSIQSSKLHIFYAVTHKDSKDRETFTPTVKDCADFFSNMTPIEHPYKRKEYMHPVEYYVKHDSQAKKVYGVYFDPDPEAPIRTDKINLFDGFEYSDNGDEYVEPGVFIDYVNTVLAAGDTALGTWILDWLADIIQNPHVKPGTALIMYSAEEGVGKSSLHEKVMKRVLGRYAFMIDGDTLKSQFTGHLSERLLITIDDIMYQGRDIADRLKTMITREYAPVQKKYKDIYELKDYARIMMTANHPNVVTINADTGSRRYTIAEVSPIHLNDRNYWSSFDYFCERNARNIFTYLLRRNITSNLRVAYITKAYNEIKKDYANIAECYINELISSDVHSYVENANVSAFAYQNAGIFGEYLIVSKQYIIEDIRRHSNERTMTSNRVMSLLRHTKFCRSGAIAIDDPRGEQIRLDKQPAVSFKLSLFNLC